MQFNATGYRKYGNAQVYIFDIYDTAIISVLLFRTKATTSKN